MVVHNLALGLWKLNTGWLWLRGVGVLKGQQGSLLNWYYLVLEETVKKALGIGVAVPFFPTWWFRLCKNSQVRKSGILF